MSTTFKFYLAIVQKSRSEPIFFSSTILHMCSGLCLDALKCVVVSLNASESVCTHLFMKLSLLNYCLYVKMNLLAMEICYTLKFQDIINFSSWKSTGWYIMDLLLTGTLLTLDDRRMKGLISQWLSLMTHIVQSKLKGCRDQIKCCLENIFHKKRTHYSYLSRWNDFSAWYSFSVSLWWIIIRFQKQTCQLAG